MGKPKKELIESKECEGCNSRITVYSGIYKFNSKLYCFKCLHKVAKEELKFTEVKEFLKPLR